MITAVQYSLYHYIRIIQANQKLEEFNILFAS